MKSFLSGFKLVYKSTFVQVAVTSVLILLSLGAWALASPVASSPDDDFHLASIWCSGNGYPGMCESGQVPNERNLSRALVQSACFAHNPSISAGCQKDLSVLHDNTLEISSRGNFNGGYPPVYYSFMHYFASNDVEFSALMMRFVNILIFMLLVITVWLFAPRSTRKMQTIPWLITCIPLGLFVLASNNPSSWGLFGIGMSSLALYGYISSPAKPLLNRFVLAGVYFVSTFMASGARGDSALFCAFTTVVIVFVSCTSWKSFREVAPIALISIALSTFLYLSSASATSVARVGSAPENIQVSPISILIQNILSLPDLFIGIFGVWGLGWLDTPMPQLVWVTCTVIYVSYVAISWQKINLRQMLSQIAVIAALVLLPLYILQKEMATVGQFLQPRYFLPLFLLLAILVFEILKSEEFTPSTFFKFAVWIGLSLTQAISLYLNMDRYIHGTGISTGLNLNKFVQWWWSGISIGPMSVFVIGSVAFCLLTYLLINPLKQEKAEPLIP